RHTWQPPDSLLHPGTPLAASHTQGHTLAASTPRTLLAASTQDTPWQPLTPRDTSGSFYTQDLLAPHTGTPLQPLHSGTHWQPPTPRTLPGSLTPRDTPWQPPTPRDTSPAASTPRTLPWQPPTLRHTLWQPPTPRGTPLAASHPGTPSGSPTPRTHPDSLLHPGTLAATPGTHPQLPPRHTLWQPSTPRYKPLTAFLHVHDCRSSWGRQN
ncbi:extensin-like, partial [Homarus americanus]|uniref:extensin-like n=1 Tax=Homarus americanus TaxID=6706 RepID=UPI001C46A873